MDQIVTPTQARKDLFKIIKRINENNEPVVIKPTKADEKSVVVIGEDDWKAIQGSSPKCWCKLNSANLSFHKLKHTGFF